MNDYQQENLEEMLRRLIMAQDSVTHRSETKGVHSYDAELVQLLKKRTVIFKEIIKYVQYLSERLERQEKS